MGDAKQATHGSGDGPPTLLVNYSAELHRRALELYGQGKPEKAQPLFQELEGILSGFGNIFGTRVRNSQ